MNIPGKLTDAQYTVTLHVPKVYNDGEAVSLSFFNSLEDELLTTFGAFDRDSSVGAWRDPDTGTVYRDPKYKYHIDVATIDDVNTLRYLAEAIRETLIQVCVYVTSAPISAYLV